MTMLWLGLAMGAAIGAFLWETTRGERLHQQLTETRNALRDLRLNNMFHSIPYEDERDEYETARDEYERELIERYWSAAQRTRPEQNAEMN